MARQQEEDWYEKAQVLVGALLSVIGALVVSSSASAAVTGQTLTTTTSPAKQQKKTFGPVGAFTNVVDTAYSGGFSPIGTQTVLTFTKDIKFTPGNIPQCNLGAINTVPQSTSDATCGASKVGSGERHDQRWDPHRQGRRVQRHPERWQPDDRPAHRRVHGRRHLLVQHHADRDSEHGQQHADRVDPADRYGDHAFLDDDQQEEVGQEEGQDQVG